MNGCKVMILFWSEVVKILHIGVHRIYICFGENVSLYLVEPAMDFEICSLSVWSTVRVVFFSSCYLDKKRTYVFCRYVCTYKYVLCRYDLSFSQCDKNGMICHKLIKILNLYFRLRFLKNNVKHWKVRHILQLATYRVSQRKLW